MHKYHRVCLVHLEVKKKNKGFRNLNTARTTITFSRIYLYCIYRIYTSQYKTTRFSPVGKEHTHKRGLEKKSPSEALTLSLLMIFLDASLSPQRAYPFYSSPLRCEEATLYTSSLLLYSNALRARASAFVSC